MTRLFKNIFLIATLLIGGMLNASCPPNYTTLTNTRVDSNGNTIFFSICFPSIVSLTVNSGQFNIYITIQNQGLTTSTGVRMCSFIPFNAIFSTVGGVITSNPANGGTLSTVANICDGSGRGDFNFATGIVSGGTATATLTVQALSAGSYTYNANTIAQGDTTGSISPTITVEATCPSVTAVNGVGATACSNSTATGNLQNFVTGGNAPYTFSTAGAVGGSVSVNGAGVYTFTPSVTGGSGSFNYQAFDIAGCSSNTGTITLPIVDSPVGGNDAFYTTTFGTPVVGTLNFTGGTAPYTITTNNIVNGNVIYNSNTAQFTFTQTAPGASFFDYNVTDANGCSLTTTPNIYIYSCNPGFTASANLFNNIIYSICAPSTVTVGTTFEITATFVNPNPVGVTPTVFALQDLVPDPSQGPAFAPGLLYLSNDGATPGSTFVPTGVNFGQGGMGSFSVDALVVPPSTSFSVTMNIQATATGLQTYTARVPSNPNFTLTVNVNVLPCPTFTGASTGISSCNNEVTGDLSSLIEGASGPFTFSQTGVATCGDVTITSTGAFIYTAPIGFTGPCSFSYFATAADGCPSTEGTVTITANLGPVATGANVFICENTILQSSLAVSGGTPPYTFSIVTNGTLGTATIDDANLGTFTYTPNPNTFGNDFFTFQVTDSAGCVSNVAQYNIGILEAPSTTGVSFTACENTPVNGDLSLFVTGGTQPYTFTGNGSPVGGFVNIGLTGPYSFTPIIGFSGPGGFEYLVTDNAGCSSTGAVDIIVSSPTITPSGIDLCTNFSASGNLATQVTGGTVPYVFGATGSSIGGTVNIQPGGGYVFTPTPGFQGQASFTYQVVDAIGCLATGTLQIDYAAPIASAGTASICENTSLIGGTLSASGGTPPYTFAIVVNGTLGTATITNPATGTFNYVPNPDTFGIDSFTFQVTDANGCVSNIAAFQIIISQTPIATALELNDCVNAALTGGLTGQLVAGTPPFGFALTGTPFGGTASVGTDGSFTFVPTNGFSGPAGFVYVVTDANGCSSTGAVDVTVSSPIVGATSVNTCLNTPVSGDLSTLVTSGFPGYTFALSAVAGGTASVSSTGIYNYVPSTGFSGPGGLVYQVTDSNGCVAVGTVDVNINSLAATDAPILSCEPSFSSNLNFFVTGGTGVLTFSGPLSISCGNVTIAPDGSFTYTAPTGFSGPCSFEYSVTDSQGCIGSGTITVTVSDPIADSLSLSGCVNGSLSGSLAGLVSGVPPFVFGLTGVVNNGSATVAPNGNFTFTPSTGFSGPASFVYEVIDANACSSTGGVDITVSSPIVGATALNACFQTPSFTGDLSSLVSSGFPPYIFGSTGVPVGGSVTVNPDGTFSFVPSIGFSGPGGFEYQVTDSNGCVSVGDVAVAVDSLVGSNASLVTCNNTFSGTLANFVTGGTGALTFTGPLVTTCGNVTIAPDGSFIYTAPTGFTGPCDFIFAVTDALGCIANGVITVVANQAPVVNNDTIVVCNNASVSGSLATLVVGQPQPPLTFNIVTFPTNGSLGVNVNTGAYTYTPNAGFSGIDSFQFTVTDSGTPPCTTNIGTVIIIVNDAPSANGGTNITCSNETITGSIVDFVTGGTPPLTFAQVGAAVNGIATVNPDGSYIFVPTPGFIGLGSFQYQVTDANGCVSNIGTFVIDIIQCCPLSDSPLMEEILDLFWGINSQQSLIAAQARSSNR